MRRFVVLSIAFVVCASLMLAASPKKYGKAISLKELTKISDIYANPEAYSGKRVKVQGPIVDVCSEKGCWIAIGSDKEFQTIRFKVDDGVIVFPMTEKGKTGVAEGVISVTTLSEADQIKQGEMHAKEMNKPFDPKSVKGPKTSIMIKGEAAEVF
jgi:hypothetical protein